MNFTNQAAIDLTKKLINFDTRTPLDNGIIDFIISFIEPIGFVCNKLPFGEDDKKVINLYAKYGKSGKNLCFAGHTDVVPPGDISKWYGNPFSAYIKDENLYGRGAVDMKTAVACFIIASNNFIINNPSFSESISLLITGDEEGEAINGTAKVIEYLKGKNEKLDACIVGEPTSSEYLGDTIKVGRRGSINFSLEIYGIQGHIAYPELADNPITTLCKVLILLKDYKLDQGNEYFSESNLEITNIVVNNETTNVIPANAKAQFNIRFNNIHTGQSLIEWVNYVLNKTAKKDSYKLTHKISGEPFLNKPGKLCASISDAIFDITTHKTTLSTSGGTSDARFIKNLCETVEFGAINKTAHKINENISLNDIKNLTEIYLKTIEYYFK